MLQEQLTASEQKLKEQLDLNATLQKDLSSAHTELQELSISLEKERAERVTILLKNAELTQNEESLKQDLKQERDDLEEWLEKVKTLQRTVVVHEKNEKDLMLEIEGLNIRMQEKENLENEFLLLTEDVNEKNKVSGWAEYVMILLFNASFDSFSDNQSAESTPGGYEEDAPGGDSWKSRPKLG